MNYLQFNYEVKKHFDCNNKDEVFDYFNSGFDRNLFWKDDADLIILFNNTVDHADIYFSIDELMQDPNKEVVYIDSFGKTIYQLVRYYPKTHRNHVILFDDKNWLVFEYTVRPPKTISSHLKEFLNELKNKVDDELPICKICKYKQYWVDHGKDGDNLPYCKTCLKRPQNTCSSCQSEIKSSINNVDIEPYHTRIELCSIEDMVQALFHQGGIIEDDYEYAIHGKHTAAVEFSFRRMRPQEFEQFVKCTDCRIFLDRENNIAMGKLRTTIRDKKYPTAMVMICDHHYFLSFKYPFQLDKIRRDS